jgi:hypothetical protein
LVLGNRVECLSQAPCTDHAAQAPPPAAVGGDAELWALAEEALGDAMEYSERRYDNTGKAELAAYRATYHESREKLRLALAARLAPSAAPGRPKCARCDGTGEVANYEPSPAGRAIRVIDPCPACNPHPKDRDHG